MHLLKSKQWAKVHCVVRRELQEWQTVHGREKLVIEKFDDLDEYFRRPNDQYRHISAVFFCLGSEVGKGEDLFVKIDKTYALTAADIAAKNSIPFFDCRYPKLPISVIKRRESIIVPVVPPSEGRG